LPALAQRANAFIGADPYAPNAFDVRKFVRLESLDSIRSDEKNIFCRAVLFSAAPIYAQDAAPTTTSPAPVVAAN
jgi:hypothetical protein